MILRRKQFGAVKATNKAAKRAHELMLGEKSSRILDKAAGKLAEKIGGSVKSIQHSQEDLIRAGRVYQKGKFGILDDTHPIHNVIDYSSGYASGASKIRGGKRLKTPNYDHVDPVNQKKLTNFLKSRAHDL